MIVYIYNNDANSVEKYIRNLNDPMPYTKNTYLTVKEFKGSSMGNILWSDKRTMQTFSDFRTYYGKPIYVGFAFKRIWEGGHSPQSQHYAGTSFDTGQNLSDAGRKALHSSANSFGKWSYVEPINLTPRWVHFDKRWSPSACKAGGYPLVKRGSKGNYVFTLQDALNALDYFTGGLDGLFGHHTENAVREYQRDRKLGVDGIAGCNTWTQLTKDAVGIGRTPTVIY